MEKVRRIANRRKRAPTEFSIMRSLPLKSQQAKEQADALMASTNNKDDAVLLSMVEHSEVYKMMEDMAATAKRITLKLVHQTQAAIVIIRYLQDVRAQNLNLAWPPPENHASLKDAGIRKKLDDYATMIKENYIDEASLACKLNLIKRALSYDLPAPPRTWRSSFPFTPWNSSRCKKEVPASCLDYGALTINQHPIINLGLMDAYKYCKQGECAEDIRTLESSAGEKCDDVQQQLISTQTCADAIGLVKMSVARENIYETAENAVQYANGVCKSKILNLAKGFKIDPTHIQKKIDTLDATLPIDTIEADIRTHLKINPSEKASLLEDPTYNISSGAKYKDMEKKSKNGVRALYELSDLAVEQDMKKTGWDVAVPLVRKIIYDSYNYDAGGLCEPRKSSSYDAFSSYFKYRMASEEADPSKNPSDIGMKTARQLYMSTSRNSFLRERAVDTLRYEFENILISFGSHVYTLYPLEPGEKTIAMWREHLDEFTKPLLSEGIDLSLNSLMDRLVHTDEAKYDIRKSKVTSALKLVEATGITDAATRSVDGPTLQSNKASLARLAGLQDTEAAKAWIGGKSLKESAAVAAKQTAGDIIKTKMQPMGFLNGLFDSSRDISDPNEIDAELWVRMSEICMHTLKDNNNYVKIVTLFIDNLRPWDERFTALFIDPLRRVKDHRISLKFLTEHGSSSDTYDAATELSVHIAEKLLHLVKYPPTGSGGTKLLAQYFPNLRNWDLALLLLSATRSIFPHDPTHPGNSDQSQVTDKQLAEIIWKKGVELATKDSRKDPSLFFPVLCAHVFGSICTVGFIAFFSSLYPEFNFTSGERTRTFLPIVLETLKTSTLEIRTKLSIKIEAVVKSSRGFMQKHGGKIALGGLGSAAVALSGLAAYKFAQKTPAAQEMQPTQLMHPMQQAPVQAMQPTQLMHPMQQAPAAQEMMHPMQQAPVQAMQQAPVQAMQQVPVQAMQPQQVPLQVMQQMPAQVQSHMPMQYPMYPPMGAHPYHSYSPLLAAHHSGQMPQYNPYANYMQAPPWGMMPYGLQPANQPAAQATSPTEKSEESKTESQAGGLRDMAQQVLSAAPQMLPLLSQAGLVPEGAAQLLGGGQSGAAALPEEEEEVAPRLPPQKERNSASLGDDFKMPSKSPRSATKLPAFNLR